MSDYRLSAVLELRDRLTGRIRNATQGLRNAGSTAGSASSSIDRVSSSMDRAGTSAGRLRQRLGNLRGNYSPTIAVRDMATPAVNRVQSSLNSISGRSASASVRVNDEATSRITRIRQELSGLTNRAYTATVNIRQNGGFSAMGSRSMGAGAQMLGVAGIGYGIVDTVNTYKDFEYQMANVKALTKASVDEFKELNAKARELGKTTMFKASDVAAAESFMALAGWSPKQITAGLSSVLDLAAASGEDLKSVSDIVTDAMTGFGITVGETVRNAKGKQVDTGTHFADVMAALMANSNTTVGLAGESAKYSAAVIGSLFKSQSEQAKMEAYEDWAVFTGLQANAGIKGSMSGTATRSMFTRMASGQMNASAALKGLGINTTYQNDEYDAVGNLIHQAGQTRRARDIIGDIRNAYSNGIEPEQLVTLAEDLSNTKNFSKQNRKKLERVLENTKKNGGVMSDADKATLTTMMSGQEALAGWLSVLMASNEEWDKMIGKIDDATGEAQRMSNVKMDTMKGDLDSLSSAWESLQLTFMGGEDGKGSSGLRSFIRAVTEDLRELDTLMKDGLSFADLGKLGSKVFKQLKDEALELNGVGSLLAGGALVLGLTKIISLSKRAADSVRSTLSLGNATGRSTANIPASASSIGSMVVHANSVVVNGRGAVGGATTGAGRNAGGTPTILGPNGRPLPPSTPAPTPTPAPAPTSAGGVGSFLKAGAGYGALANGYCRNQKRP